eukprot:3623361-Prorocentrum_lima.AAC.1
MIKGCTQAAVPHFNHCCYEVGQGRIQVIRLDQDQKFQFITQGIQISHTAHLGCQEKVWTT